MASGPEKYYAEAHDEFKKALVILEEESTT